VKHELSQQFWAVRSKPAATGMTHSYLEPNSQSLQEPIEGGRPQPTYLVPISNSMQYPKRGRSLLPFSVLISMLKFSALSKGRGGHREQAQWLQHSRNPPFKRNQKTPKHHSQTSKQKKLIGLWGLEICLRGRRESVKNYCSPNLSTQPMLSGFFFPLCPPSP
jgi:hypothetical protein